MLPFTQRQNVLCVDKQKDDVEDKSLVVVAVVVGSVNLNITKSTCAVYHLQRSMVKTKRACSMFVHSFILFAQKVYLTSLVSSVFTSILGNQPKYSTY